MWLSTGLVLDGLAAPLGLYNHLPTRNFAYLTLLTAPLRLPLSFSSKQELARTKVFRRSYMEDDTSLRNLVMSSADETAILLEIGDGETTWMLSQLETTYMSSPSLSLLLLASSFSIFMKSPQLVQAKFLQARWRDHHKPHHLCCLVEQCH